MFFLYLMACAGLTFGLQHKAIFLHKKLSFLDRMFACTYCTGFHSGWLVYVIANYENILVNQAVIFAFASSMFSYALDEAVKYLEANSQEE